MIYLVSNQTSVFNKSFKQISLEESLEMLQGFKELGLDTETQGLDYFKDKLISMQLGDDDFQIVYDLSSYDGQIPKLLKHFLQNTDILFIIQNAKFDLKFLYNQDIFLKNVFDTMLAEHILTMGLQIKGRDLATIANKYCQVTLDKSERMNITKGLTDSGILYAANDIVYLIDIKKKQSKYIKNLNLENALKLDNEFVKVLAYIEFCGIKLDWEKWRDKAFKDLEKAANKKKELNLWLKNSGFNEYFQTTLDMFDDTPSCTLNWNSSKQVITLFEKIGINCNFKDKGVDKKTVEEKVIGKFKDDFPILKLYFSYKESIKLTSTYGLNWEKMINPITGRIHTNFKQLMNTGRLSCGNARENKPNLQNLPSDVFTRSCFIAEKGSKFIAADYSSQEQIVLANFSKEPNLINFYSKGFTDMHSYVAFLMYPDIRRCTIEELQPNSLNYIKKEYPELRYLAKTAGFAIEPFYLI